MKRGVAVSSLAFVLASTSALAQKAQTGPVTPNLITLTFILPGRSPSTVMLHEGELGRFGDGHTTYGVVARLQPEGEALTVRVFEILTFDGGGEGIVLLSKTSLLPGAQANITSPPMSLSIDEVQRTVQYQPAQQEEAAVDDCCVFCADIWVCALCVKVDCGCCCDPGYCHRRCSDDCPKPPQ